MIPKKEELAYHAIVPSTVPLWVTPGNYDRLRSSKLGHTLKKKCHDQEQGHCVPHANLVKHSGVLKSRLEINF